jgi:hypothetical protein
MLYMVVERFRDGDPAPGSATGAGSFPTASATSRAG